MPSYFRVGEGSSSSLREHPFGVGCRNHRKKYTGVRLLIAVKSGVDGSQQRTVTRNTFQAVAKRKYPDVAVVSFIARTSDKELQAKGLLPITPFTRQKLTNFIDSMEKL